MYETLFKYNWIEKTVIFSVIIIVNKNIARHRAHTIDSWPDDFEIISNNQQCKHIYQEIVLISSYT